MESLQGKVCRGKTLRELMGQKPMSNYEHWTLVAPVRNHSP